MLIDWIVGLFVEVPLLLFDLGLYRVSCPKCGNRLKYVPKEPNQVQCVMCEQIWLKGKRGYLSAVDPKGS